jgi:hypothetical protein
MALFQRLGFWLLFIALSGCGGSGEGGLSRVEKPDGGVANTYVPIIISLTISDAGLTQATPAMLTATVTQGSIPLSGKLVLFSIDNEELASFDTDVSSSSTDADGHAVIKRLLMMLSQHL